MKIEIAGEIKYVQREVATTISRICYNEKLGEHSSRSSWDIYDIHMCHMIRSQKINSSKLELQHV